MISETTLNANKAEFLSLVDSIERDKVNKNQLIAQLCGSDFFTAPASTIYHCAYRGGLCQHSLNVYKALLSLMKINYSDLTLTDSDGNVKVTTGCPYSADTLKIVALFHDFSKMSFYEPSIQNKKVYSDTGSKHDEMGKFDWQSVPGFKVRDAKDRFIYGNHEINSVYMTETFIPLTLEESTAILHHMGGMASDSSKDEISVVYSKYPLALYLHLADMLATYTLENE